MGYTGDREERRGAAQRAERGWEGKCGREKMEEEGEGSGGGKAEAECNEFEKSGALRLHT